MVSLASSPISYKIASLRPVHSGLALQQQQDPSLEQRLASLVQKHEQFLGPTLAWQERRLFERLHRYSDDLERLENIPADQWRPRVRFVTVEGPGDLIDHGDHVAFIPRWTLICPVDRKKWAVDTCRAKLAAVDRRLGQFHDIVQARRYEFAALRSQNNLLHAFLAPKRRRT